jgi:hypothetical protein
MIACPCHPLSKQMVHTVCKPLKQLLLCKGCDFERYGDTYVTTPVPPLIFDSIDLAYIKYDGLQLSNSSIVTELAVEKRFRH